MKVEIPRLIGGISVHATGKHGVSGACLRNQTWVIPPVKTTYELEGEEKQYVFRLTDDSRQGLWIGVWKELPFGAVITSDLVNAAEAGKFHEAIIPPIIQAGNSLWQTRIIQMGFVFALRMGKMEWGDVFEYWEQHASETEGKIRPAEFYPLPRFSEHKTKIFPDHENIQAGMMESGEKPLLTHYLSSGLGRHFKGPILHPSLGVLWSNLQKGTLAIGEGIMIVDGATKSDTGISAKIYLGPHFLAPMTDIVRQLHRVVRSEE